MPLCVFWVAEVMKALWAKKYAKMKKTQAASADMAGRVNEKLGGGLEFAVRRSEMEKNHQVNFYFLYLLIENSHINMIQPKLHIHQEYRN